jgi:RNA polymerase sigma-70 factor (sigma-E family)
MGVGMSATGASACLSWATPRWRSADWVTSSEEFIEFATVSSPRLRRTAFLLCGDWHTAEDLAQATLANVFGSWRRISRKDAADAYATRTLVNIYLADRRRKRVSEVLTGTLPEHAVQPQAPETRLVVLDALATLPPGARAVVVLRFWSDLSVEQVAAMLGCSAGNVKSQSARALDKLRILLGGPGAETGLTGPEPIQRHETNETMGASDG